jgi:pimeloyl-ACP methyl ester carboxylesterase
VRLAFWPGLGGGSKTLIELEAPLAERGIDATTSDPLYGNRTDWRLGTLAAELAATGADVYGGHSWGGAVAATAAAESPPSALVLLDGGHLGPRDAPLFGSAPTADERVAEIRRDHAGYRWPSLDSYLDVCRENSPRWNDLIEAAALEGMQQRDGEVLPPFDEDELERILRGYEEYDPVATLSRLDPHVRVLLVLANAEDEHAVARTELGDRFIRTVPHARVERVANGHDVVWGLGPALADLIADWLEAA